MNLFIIAIFVLNAQLGTALHYPQYFQAFSHKSCIGDSTDFLGSNFNITAEFPNIRIKSFSARGMWIIRAEGLTISTGYSSGLKICSTAIMPEFIVAESVQQVGFGDLDDSVLTLYPNDDFKGTAVVIDVDESRKVDPPAIVMSYALTGPKSVTLFDEEGFTGNSTCLETRAEFDGLGVSGANLQEQLVVRSVKFGCDFSHAGIRRIQGKSDTISITRDSDGAEVKGLYRVDPIPKVVMMMP